MNRSFGAFQAVRSFKPGMAGFEIWAALRTGETGAPRYAIKAFTPDELLDEQERRAEIELFLGVARAMQQLGATGAMVPVHELGVAGSGDAPQGYYVTDLYQTADGQPKNVERLSIQLKKPLGDEQIGALVTRLARGLRALHATGRGHGRLLPTNIFLPDFDNPGQSRVLLADPLRPDQHHAGVPGEDVQELGWLIHELVVHRARPMDKRTRLNRPLPELERWQAPPGIKRNAKLWRALCARLVGIDIENPLSLDGLLAELKAFDVGARDAQIAAVAAEASARAEADARAKADAAAQAAQAARARAEAEAQARAKEQAEAEARAQAAALEEAARKTREEAAARERERIAQAEQARALEAERQRLEAERQRLEVQRHTEELARADEARRAEQARKEADARAEAEAKLRAQREREEQERKAREQAQREAEQRAQQAKAQEDARRAEQARKEADARAAAQAKAAADAAAKAAAQAPAPPPQTPKPAEEPAPADAPTPARVPAASKSKPPVALLAGAGAGVLVLAVGGYMLFGRGSPGPAPTPAPTPTPTPAPDPSLAGGTPAPLPPPVTTPIDPVAPPVVTPSTPSPAPVDLTSVERLINEQPALADTPLAQELARLRANPDAAGAERLRRRAEFARAQAGALAPTIDLTGLDPAAADELTRVAQEALRRSKAWNDVLNWPGDDAQPPAALADAVQRQLAATQADAQNIARAAQELSAELAKDQPADAAIDRASAALEDSALLGDAPALRQRLTAGAAQWRAIKPWRLQREQELSGAFADKAWADAAIAQVKARPEWRQVLEVRNPVAPEAADAANALVRATRAVREPWDKAQTLADRLADYRRLNPGPLQDVPVPGASATAGQLLTQIEQAAQATGADGALALLSPGHQALREQLQGAGAQQAQAAALEARRVQWLADLASKPRDQFRAHFEGAEVPQWRTDALAQPRVARKWLIVQLDGASGDAGEVSRLLSSPEAGALNQAERDALAQALTPRGGTTGGGGTPALPGGWQWTTPPGAGELAVIGSGGPTMTFKRLPTGAYVATHEFSVGQFIATSEAIVNLLPDLIGKQSVPTAENRKGVRTWLFESWITKKVASAGERVIVPRARSARKGNGWLLDDYTGADEGGYYGSFAPPSADLPMQDISSEGAEKIARSLQMRLPRLEEWRAALASAQGDARHLASRVTVNFVRQAPATPQAVSIRDLLLNTMNAQGRKRRSSWTTEDMNIVFAREPQLGGIADTPFFVSVSPASVNYAHLIGNVAEWVTNNGEVVAVGASCLSEPSILPDQPIKPDTSQMFFADVGFRLAFDAGAPSSPPSVDLAQVRQAIANLPF